MKKIFLLLALTQACFTAHTFAAQAQADTPYAVTERGPHHRVWQRTTYDLGPDGQLAPHVHSYTELATGLHYQDATGNWVESKAQINLLPNGAGAVATNGQHKVIFPPDIYGGQIELNTPDNKWLRSQVLGLSYYDTSSGQSVMIAELTNSTGLLHGPNLVIYPHAFTDFDADVRYTYTIAGFEQDIILRQQPPSPGDYGLNPTTTHLEVLTEFFNPPVPTVKPVGIVGTSASDNLLDFGTMRISRGKAFSMGEKSSGPGRVRVAKSWSKLDGRDFLIENVSFASIAPSLIGLPAPPVAVNPRTVSPGTVLHRVATHRLLPSPHLARQNVHSVQMAKSGWSPSADTGYVLDYQILNSLTSQFTFRGDTTYYINGSMEIAGPATIEGGTVIKYYPSPGGSSCIQMDGPNVYCQTGPYRPAIFTSQDDNSVGETISGSTGTPVTDQNYNGYLTILNMTQVSLHDLRMNYGCFPLETYWCASVNVTNIQVVHSVYPFLFFNAPQCNASLCNVLMEDVQIMGIFAEQANVSLQNVTVDQCNVLAVDEGDPSSIAATNCIFANMTNWSMGMSLVSFDDVTNNSPSTFQTVGAGNYYLADSSPYRNAGTTNINAGLLAALKTKTTYPPIVYSNIVISVNTTLTPQAQRDTDVPDLGYHYDPIDYVTDLYAVTNNAQLTITNGAAIAYLNNFGILLPQAASINSIGTVLAPNWITHYQTVQEQAVAWDTSAAISMPINPYHSTNPPAAGIFCFTKFTMPAGYNYQLYHVSDPDEYNPLTVNNCEFWGGHNYLGGGSNSVAVIDNNLFYHSIVDTTTTSGGPGTTASLCFSNNTIYFTATNTFRPSGPTPFYVFNNVFDTCVFSSRAGFVTCTNGYNAYINCTNRLIPTYAGDITLTNTFAWQTGPLGNFYQPTNSQFINAGSVTADLAGLYHYTTQTNLPSVVESNTVVDLGYHYVGVDANGNPLDSDGDGVPDYLEDANGNGVVDGSENSWTNYNSLNGLSSGSGMQVFTPLK